MSGSPVAATSERTPADDTNNTVLPLAAMVRALCRAASTGPDMLYDVMLKLALMVDATAQTYGLATFAQVAGAHPQLNWVEGLGAAELAAGAAQVAAALATPDAWAAVRAGDRALCLVLAVPTAQRAGAAIYGRCVRPLTERQARALRLLADVAQLAHAHALLLEASAPARPVPRPALAVVATALPGMVYVSRAMAALARAVERVKDSDSTVLITGESGTGKELVARAVHRLSRRANGPFVPFNCTAAPAELIESLLFGHRKGAFTGAHADHEGLVRAAEGGTLFLDELGDLPPALQPKLLRFLQEGEVHTLGARAPRKVNVRVVAATHKDLERAVAAERFREDLYYRVAALSLHVPPLRERPEDVAALISHYLTHFARRNDRAVAGLTADAVAALQQYAWPGNVRELAAEMERLVLYADEGAVIDCAQLNPRIRPQGAGVAAAPDEQPAPLEHLLDDFERRVITETLRLHDYNVARAATALGLGSRQTLYKKLKRLAINVGDFLQDEQQPGRQLRARG